MMFTLPLLLAPTGREGVTIADILQFYSGADKIPAIGFDATPKIGFTSDECLPRVSTCDLSITFPRSMGLLSFDKFAETMDLCFKVPLALGQFKVYRCLVSRWYYPHNILATCYSMLSYLHFSCTLWYSFTLNLSEVSVVIQAISCMCRHVHCGHCSFCYQPTLSKRI